MGESEITTSLETSLRPQWKRQDFTRGSIATTDLQRSSADPTSPNFNTTNPTPYRSKTPSNNSTPRSQPNRPINRSYSGNVRTSRDGNRGEHNNAVDRGQQRREELAMLFPEGPGRQRREPTSSLSQYTSSPRLKTALVADNINSDGFSPRPPHHQQQQNGRGFLSLSRSQTAPASPAAGGGGGGTPNGLGSGGGSGSGPDHFAAGRRAENASSWRKSSHSPRHNDSSGVNDGGSTRQWHSKLVGDSPSSAGTTTPTAAAAANTVRSGGGGVWGHANGTTNGTANEHQHYQQQQNSLKPTAASIVAASLTTSTNSKEGTTTTIGTSSSRGSSLDHRPKSIDIMAKQAKLVPIAAFSKDTDKHKKNGGGLLLQRQSSAQVKLQTAVGSALARSRSDATNNASTNSNSNGFVSLNGGQMVVMELKRKPSKFAVLGGGAGNNKPSSSPPTTNSESNANGVSHSSDNGSNDSDSAVTEKLGGRVAWQSNAPPASVKEAQITVTETNTNNANNNHASSNDTTTDKNNEQQKQQKEDFCGGVYESSSPAAIDNGAVVSAPLEVLALEDEFLMSLGFIAEEIN